MNSFHFRSATVADFPQIARLIIEQNQDPARQCLHSGDRYENTLNTMVKYSEAGEFCLVIAVQDERIVTILGSEFEESLSRGWLWGPFSLTEASDMVLPELFQALRGLLPATITRLDGYLNIENKNGVQFYQENGFYQSDLVHVYIAPRPQTDFSLIQPCDVLSSQHASSFRALFQLIFPHTFETGQSILSKIDEDHKVFVEATQDQVFGYLYGYVEDDEGSGYIEYVGVQPEARNQGIGRRLLLTALKWFFDERGLPEVALTVNDKLANARSLYESVGFQLTYTGVNMRKSEEAHHPSS